MVMICEQVKKVFPFRFVIVTAKESKKNNNSEKFNAYKIIFFLEFPDLSLNVIYN